MSGVDRHNTIQYNTIQRCTTLCSDCSRRVEGPESPSDSSTHLLLQLHHSLLALSHEACSEEDTRKRGERRQGKADQDIGSLDINFNQLAGEAQGKGHMKRERMEGGLECISD